MNGATPMYWAAMEDRESICALLVERGATLKTTDGRGWNALHWSVHHKTTNTARLLVGRVQDKDAQDKELHWTALHMAAKGGDRETVIALMDGGVDHTSKAAKDKQGRYAVHWAAEQDMVPEGTSRPNKIFSWPTEEEKAKGIKPKELWSESPPWGSEEFYKAIGVHKKIQYYYNVKGSMFLS